MQRICPNCGSEVPDDTTKCVICGAALEEPGSDHKERKKEDKIESFKYQKLMIILTCVIFCVLLIGLMHYLKGARGSDNNPDPATNSGEGDTITEPVPTPADRDIVNIYCWDNEFPDRMMNHYPGFTANDPADAAKGGMIGDIAVQFVVISNNNNMYQVYLDDALMNQDEAAEDAKVDIFLVESDFLEKYVNAELDVAMPLSELGITETDLKKQFRYTKTVASDADGMLRGSSWQACAGGLIYNRSIAAEVLGSDDPEIVQAAVDDWDRFNETARKMKDAGYRITATAEDTFRAYTSKVTGRWVQDGQIIIDPDYQKWAEYSKELVDAGTTTNGSTWSDDWYKGFMEPGDVFCYFGPAWLINYDIPSALGINDDASIAHAGGWGFVNGPQNYYWGGTWICAARGTNNEEIVKDIILNMTANEEVMMDMAVQDFECVNNKEVLQKLSLDKTYGNAKLGGQNPFFLFYLSAEQVDVKSVSEYDKVCSEEYQYAMRSFFGGKSTYEEALEQFIKAVRRVYPELEYTPQSLPSEAEITPEEDEEIIKEAESGNESFYGIWCSAFKDLNDAEKAASKMEADGLEARIFITTEWSDLNSEKWYVLSAGIYDSQADAEDELPYVQQFYPKAYIKYSGDYIGH